MRNRSTQNIRHSLRRGFTLVELLIVIIIIAVLAAVAIPKFANSSTRSKEGTLRSDLKIVRNAVEMFRADTGLSPVEIDHLEASTLATGTKGVNPGGALVDIPANTFRGPYIADVPVDPVSGAGFTYTGAGLTAGTVKSSMPAGSLDSNNVAFSTY